MKKARAARIGASSLLLLALLGAGIAQATDSPEGLPTGSKAGELKREASEQAAKASLQTELPNPYALTAPLMSGSSWLTLTGRNPSLQLRSGPKSEAGAVTLLQNLVYTAPAAPPLAPAGQGPALVPYRSPAPAFSRNLLLTRDFSASTFQTEPSIAVDPKDPDHLVMSTIDYNFPSNSSYVSIDGGETWQGPFQSKYVREDLGAAGDPVVAFDRSGKVHSIGISIGDEEFAIGPLVAFLNISSIFITNSADGGFTWTEPIDTIRSGLSSDTREDPEGRTRGSVRLSFLDKPWLSVGPNPTKKDQDNMYITYTDFEESFQIYYVGEQPILGLPRLETTIRMVRSEDGGKSWSDPVDVSPTVLLEFGGRGSETGEAGTSPKRIVQGSQPKVAPDGTVYVTWMDTTDDDSQKGLGEIYVARSTDGGKSFQEPVRAAALKEPGFTPRTASFRYWGSVFPQIAIGPQGDVYVVYVALPPDKILDDGDVYLVRSRNRGQDWSTPRRLNGDDTDRLQFFPSIATSPNGNIHVMWGDMRDDPVETRYHIYYTRSENRGDSWGFDLPALGLSEPDTRVTDFPSNPNKGFPGGRFIGDYFSIAAADEDVYMVWADTRLGEFGPLNQKIGFARRRAITTPQVFLSPPAGSGGEPITIQGFNFQPDLTYFVSVGGVTIQAARTDAEGQFTTQIFVPISGKGAHNVQVFDESGNVATASFFMEFGFDNVQDVQDAILQELKDLRAGLAGGLTAAPPPASNAPDTTRPAQPASGGGASNTLSLALLSVLVAAVILGLVVALGRRRPTPQGPGP